MSFNAIHATTPNLPTGNISLNFKGMMALSEKANPRQYEFLCHGDSDGTRSHDLGIRIDGKRLSKTTEFKNFEFYVLDKNIDKPSANNSIAAYNPNQLNDNAFNHIVDIEAVYGMELRKANPLKFSNRIIVKNGILHTTKISDYEYSLVDTKGNEIMPPRQISLELGIDISLAENEVGVLKWTDETGKAHTQQFGNDKNHHLLFDNYCTDTSNYNLKSIDSDFPLNFVNIIDDPTILKCDTKEYVNIMSSDDYPCTIIFFGLTDGWDILIGWLSGNKP